MLASGRNIPLAVPRRWTVIPLAELAADERNAITDGPFGSKLKTEHYTAAGPRVVRLKNIGDAEFVDAKAHISEAHFSSLQKHCVFPGDIVIAALGENPPRSCVIPESLGPAIVKADCIRFKPGSRVLPKFLNYVLNAPDLRRHAKGIIHGVGRPRLNLGEIKALPIPVPPLDEQQSIVSEIEKQFTRLDAGVAALRRVQANLKRYRAAVLKSACEGRLVRAEAELAKAENRNFESGQELLERILVTRRQAWRRGRKYKEPVAPRTAELRSLPEGWAWASAEQLNLANRPCAYGVLQPGEDVRDGVPFVRVGDINNGKVERGSLKRISTAVAAQYPRTKLEGGELAITLVGAIGRTAIIPESLAGGNTARAVGIIPLTQQVNAHWIEIWFRSPTMTAEMNSKSHEVARKTLNLEDVRAASVALPPFAEQVRIVAEVERRLSVVDELETAMFGARRRAHQLRQSVLQSAFSEQLNSTTL